MKETIVSTRIEPKLLKQLEKIGERDDRTVSYLVRKAVEEFLERQSKQKRGAKRKLEFTPV
jgi:predicted transcriptional regulator